MRSTVFAALLAAALVLVSPAAARSEAPAGAEPVLTSAAEALGMKNISQLKGVHASGKITIYGLSGTADMWFAATQPASAIYTHLGALSQDQGFDGSVAWTRDTKGVVYVGGSASDHSGALNDAFRSAYDLWKPGHGGATVSLGDRKSEGGHDFDVVRVEVPGSTVPFDVWIDAASHLPARVVETDGPQVTTTNYSDYRPVHGVLYPFAVHSNSQGNDTAFAIENVEANPGGLAEHLRKPVSDVHDYSILGGASSTTVPMSLSDNHVRLEVMLNGKGPYHFLFDTGGSNVIDAEVAREIGAAATGDLQGGGVGASTEEFHFATVKSLRIGEAELRDQFFAVGPVRAGFGTAGSAPVDGLIGFEVLARFVTVFDYAHDRLVFRLPGTGTIVGATVPFVFAGTQPQIACTIDGIQTVCSVDTGSRSSLDLLAPFIKAHPSLVPANASAPGVNGFGVGGSQTGRLGRLGSLRIGPYDLKELVAGFSEGNGGFFANNGIGANVGGGVWKRFTVTFDYPENVMALAPNQSLGARDEYERAGMFLIFSKGHVVVVDVRAGTPAAAAGFVKGDVIATLDGAALTNLGTARAAFRQASGTVLRLGVLHKDASAPVEVSLTLRDFV